MISKQEVEKTAKLARLNLTDEELKKLTQDLVRVLDYCKAIQQIDTSEVEVNLAESHPVNQNRSDEPVDSGIQKDILDQAPEVDGTYFEVKEVLD